MELLNGNESNNLKNLKDSELDEQTLYFAKLGGIMSKAASCKNNGFNEEKEYRLISMFCDQHPTYFREKSGVVIPYTKIGLSQAKQSVKVIVGPTQHIDISVASVKRLLQEHKWKDDPDVQPSKISYRDG